MQNLENPQKDMQIAQSLLGLVICNIMIHMWGPRVESDFLAPF